MQTYANKFDQLITNKGLPSFVLVFGDEPQQKIEIIDSVRKHAKQSGFEERQTLVADAEFSWSQLLDATQTLSLFSDKQYIELTLPTGKPGVEGAKVLASICEEPSPDTLILIQGPRIGKDVQKTKWFKALDEHAIFVHTYPLEGNQLFQWIANTAQAADFQLSQHAISIIADCSEGNLMAAKQELEKLRLLCDKDSSTVSDELVASSVIDQSRFNVFQFVDELLAGNMQKAIKILQALESEGLEPNVVLWSLIKEAQTLKSCHDMQVQHGNINFNQLRIWANKQSLYRQALSRLTPSDIDIMLKDLQEADLLLKTEQVNKPFVILSHLAILFLPQKLVPLT